MPNAYYNREDRKDQIVLALISLIDQGKPPEATAYKIAKLIDMATSSHLYSILSDMVAENRLKVRDERKGELMEHSIYSLPEGSYQMPKREILINGKRQVIQESLF